MLIILAFEGCGVAFPGAPDRRNLSPSVSFPEEQSLKWAEFANGGLVFCAQEIIPKWNLCVASHPAFDGFKYAGVYSNVDSRQRFYAISAYDGPVTESIMDSVRIYVTRVYIVDNGLLFGSIDLGAYGQESRYNYYQQISDSTYRAVCRGNGKTPRVASTFDFIVSLSDFGTSMTSAMAADPSCLERIEHPSRLIPNVIALFPR